MAETNDKTNDGWNLDYDTQTEGPSKPGMPERERSKRAADPRSPGYDKHLDGPVSPGV